MYRTLLDFSDTVSVQFRGDMHLIVFFGQLFSVLLFRDFRSLMEFECGHHAPLPYPLMLYIFILLFNPNFFFVTKFIDSTTDVVIASRLIVACLLM